MMTQRFEIFSRIRYEIYYRLVYLYIINQNYLVRLSL